MNRTKNGTRCWMIGTGPLTGASNSQPRAGRGAWSCRPADADHIARLKAETAQLNTVGLD
ncbi:MAG: hypothetical protein IPO29_19840 [Anaerolineae bacterium]|nr:hypothetical protein [Anaerolineae bacterium]